MSWRQADCRDIFPRGCKLWREEKLTGVIGHINNLYNTTFWALVQQGRMTTQEAEDTLKVIYDSVSDCLPLLTKCVGHPLERQERNSFLTVQD